jgi:hypothetical protein
MLTGDDVTVDDVISCRRGLWIIASSRRIILPPHGFDLIVGHDVITDCKNLRIRVCTSL